MPFYYTSDTHLHHDAIIQHCQRPFTSGDEMTEVLWTHLVEIDQAGGSLVHAGDFALQKGLQCLLADPARRFAGVDRHQLVTGNHDSWTDDPVISAEIRERFFGTLHPETGVIIEDTVTGVVTRVLVSHRPQRDLRGADFNLYGHLHNNLARQSPKHREDFWVEGSPHHFNICVELTDYRPLRLEELVARRRGGAALW